MWQRLTDDNLLMIARRKARQGDPIPTDLAAEIDRRGFILPTN